MYAIQVTAGQYATQVTAGQYATILTAGQYATLVTAGQYATSVKTIIFCLQIHGVDLVAVVALWAWLRTSAAVVHKVAYTHFFLFQKSVHDFKLVCLTLQP